MKTPPAGTIPAAGEIGATLAAAGLHDLPERALERFHAYLELLGRWNQRINLTSDREPSQILERHLIECVFAAQSLPVETRTVLDFGSGAGLPGVPIAVCRPEIRVTLAESQAKKGAFLEEAIRVLGIEASVYHSRVESMPPGQLFDTVTLRAVERMVESIPVAGRHARTHLAWMTTRSANARMEPQIRAIPFLWNEPIPLPQSRQGILLLGHRTSAEPT